MNVNAIDVLSALTMRQIINSLVYKDIQ